MITNTVATRITVDDQMTKHLQNVQRHMQTFAGQVDKQSSNISRDFARIATSVISLTAAFQGIKKVVNEGISFNRFMQEQQTAFTVMMKSTDAAKHKIAELYDYAVNTPLTFKETTSAAKQLMAYGFQSEELLGSLRTLGTVAKATGHSLSDITYVYGTLRSQGRAYSRDLMQFGMRGIPIYEELGKVMGVSNEELKKMTEQGKVGFKEVEQAFNNMTGEGGRFFGMLEEYMGTLSGKLSMLTDIFQQSAGKISKGITDQLTAGLDGLMDTMRDSGDVFAEIGMYLGDIAGALLQMVINLIKLLPLIKILVGIFITAKILTLVSGLSKAFFLLGERALMAAVGIEAMSLSMTKAALYTTFSYAAQGVGLLLKQLAVLVAHPAVATLIAVAAATGLIVSHINKTRVQRAEDLASDPAKVLQSDLADRMRAAAKASSGGGSRQQLNTNTVAKYTWDAIIQAAATYKMSIIDTAKIIESFGLVADSAKEQLAKYMAEDSAKRAANQAVATAAGQQQQFQAWVQSQPWASTAAAIGVDPYTVSRSGSLGADKGVPIVGDFMKAFMETLPDFNMRDLLKSAGVSEGILEVETKKIMEDRIKQTQTALTDLIMRDLDNLGDQNPRLKAELAKLLNTMTEELDKMGKDGEPLIKMDKWFDQEYMVKATEQMYDDISLQRYKDLAKAEEMFADKKISEEQHANAVLAIQEIYYNEKDRLRKEDLQKERDAALERFNLLAGGDPKYFEDARIKAEASFSRGDYGEGTASSMVAGMEGSSIGRLLSSADKAATALIMFADAAADTANQLLSEILGGIEGINIKQSTTNIANAISGFINGLTGATNNIKELEKQLDTLNDQYNLLKTDFDLLVGAIKDMVGAQVDSLQDLYEVGALSGAEYSGAVDALNMEMEDNIRSAYDAAGLEYRTLANIVAKDSTLVEVYSRLGDVALALGVSADAIDKQNTELAKANEGTSWASDAVSMGMSGAAIGAAVGGPLGAVIGGATGAIVGGLGDAFGWWDTGATEIAKDQFGMVHKGETIIPKTFADGIRSGEMVLSGGGNSRSTSLGGDTYVTVNVEGSVQAEEDLATSIAQAIYKQRRIGALTV